MKTFFDIKKTIYSLFILPALLLSASVASAQSVVTFSTLKFVRTAGPSNVFSQTVTIPSSLSAPFTLSMVNGDPSSMSNNGVSISGAVSSGSVLIDGFEVISPNDFSKVAREITIPLSLSPGTHKLDVKLDGRPNSFITLSFLGVQSSAPTSANPFQSK